MLSWLPAFVSRPAAESLGDTADGTSPVVSVADATTAVENAKHTLLVAERAKAVAVLAAADKRWSAAAIYTEAAAAAQELAKESTAAADGAAAAAVKHTKAAAAAQESAKALAAAVGLHVMADVLKDTGHRRHLDCGNDDHDENQVYKKYKKRRLYFPGL